MKEKQNLKNFKIALVTHEYATGPSHSLETYLRDKSKNLFFIAHPFVFAKDIRSHYRFYGHNGKLLDEKFAARFFRIQTLSLLKDLFLSFYWLSKKPPFDVFIGVDNINVFLGVIFKKLGRVKKIVFYTIDYIPNRFENKIINTIYHFLDRFAVKHSDIVWNLSPVMQQEREKRGVPTQYKKKQIVVPVGTENNIRDVSFNKIKRFHLAHMGHLTKKQGVQTVLRAIPFIVKRIPNFHFDILGGGDYESDLKKLVSELNIQKYVTFHGYIKSHFELEKKLSSCSLAIAPYVNEKNNFIRYTDPGKVKAYLAAGLPIVITKVPPVWRELEKNKCGVGVSDDFKKIAKVVATLMLDTDKLKLYRKNARKMSKEFSWEKVFGKAIQLTVNLFN